MSIQTERLVASQEPKLALAFDQMVVRIRSRWTLAEIASAIEAGRAEQALEQALRASAMLGEAFTDSFIVAAKDTSRSIDRTVLRKVFNPANTNAVNAMNEHQLRLVRGFNEQQREATIAAIVRGLREGKNPREIARLFRASIGLTPRQWDAVTNYRLALEELDTRALARELRDKRYDRTVEAAIEAKQQLTQAQIDAMVQRYTERMLVRRSETIARTEAMRSVHEGVNAMYQQAIDQGDLLQEQLSRVWHRVPDNLVRDHHDSMHGQTRAFGEPFVSGLGNSLMYPGDANAPGVDTINCRCAVAIRIAVLA